MARKPKNMETETLAIADDFVIQKEFIELIDERFTAKRNQDSGKKD
jgi:hypothetical protein